ncbi:MAG: glycosyltransferase [Methylococcaceae bacterium]
MNDTVIDTVSICREETKERVSDIFYLNIEDAYAEAIKQNKIQNDDGSERLQYCYYDGELTDIVLPNFVQLSADNFVDILSNNFIPIPEFIGVSKEGVLSLNEMPLDIIKEIVQYRNQLKPANFIHEDCYFSDSMEALNTAKQNNRVFCNHPIIDGLQVCYYKGELPENNIANLIHLELNDFIDFLTESTFRIPTKIEVNKDIKESFNIALIEDAISAVKKNRVHIYDQLAIKARELIPSFTNEQPLRVLIAASRMTTVMQYCSYNVAKEFDARGYDVLFYIDENDMCGYNAVDFIKYYIEFNPHITFSVNHLKNDFQNKDVVNIVWWQDYMPALKTHQRFNIRKNDYLFSISPFLDDLLEQCGVEKVYRQLFVVDPDIFNTFQVEKREDKVVFVGSSYSFRIDENDDEQQKVINCLLDVFKNSGTFSQKIINEIVNDSTLDYDFIFWGLFHYVIRDYSVDWLCRNQALPVQIYGRYWNKKVNVKKYFQGELAHGIDVAKVYKSAKYALVSHPFEINSQRLAEVAACGCIPIVYDCRDIAEKPFWEDHCLFFKTQDDLNKILEAKVMPKKPPETIAEYFTYQQAVDNFMSSSGI